MMDKVTFAPNDEHTIGVELELALVDEQTMALSSSISDVLEQLPESSRGKNFSGATPSEVNTASDNQRISMEFRVNFASASRAAGVLLSPRDSAS